VATADLSATAVTSNPVAAGVPAAWGVQPQGIDWDNVRRVFGGMVECEAFRPIAELIYFPALTTCVPDPASGTAVLIVISLF
jgi:hypothetical protein